ncbi:MAG: hypothetical protein JRI54_12970 [Deltaproteobacteria bacterium]|nr:hypothetical protein [Deltaproteobacteria bacterium]
MNNVIAIIHLTSYGFLHPGRERFKRVTKEAWPLIPGSTLYGAVAAALIRLDCQMERASLEACTQCQAKGRIDCGYLALLTEVREKRLRFSPLVVSAFKPDQGFYTAADYSREAVQAAARLGICPRAPLGRETATIYKERLHGLVAHQPLQHYRGVVRTTAGFLPQLQRALRVLPFFPCGGGRGKFTQTEAQIVQKFANESDFCPPRRITRLGLLTPAILPPDCRSLGSIGGSDKYDLENFRLRRYTFWRTGLYWEEGDTNMFKGYGGPTLQAHLTQARLGLAEETVLHLSEAQPQAIQRLFLDGLGAADYTYLGWGQVYFQE